MSDLLSPSRGRRCDWPFAGATAQVLAGHFLRGSTGCSTRLRKQEVSQHRLQEKQAPEEGHRHGHRGCKRQVQHSPKPCPNIHSGRPPWNSRACRWAAGVPLRTICKQQPRRRRRATPEASEARAEHRKRPSPAPEENRDTRPVPLHRPGGDATRRSRSAQSTSSSRRGVVAAVRLATLPQAMPARSTYGLKITPRATTHPLYRQCNTLLSLVNRHSCVIFSFFLCVCFYFYDYFTRPLSRYRVARAAEFYEFLSALSDEARGCSLDSGETEFEFSSFEGRFLRQGRSDSIGNFFQVDVVTRRVLEIVS